MTPPRLSHWLLQRALPWNEREFSLGDLHEEFAERAERDPRRARAWYRRQARRALAHRLGRALRGTDSPTTTLAGTLHDLRAAARGLLRGPAFSATAVATLALGIGANTAIYAVVDAVLLRGLPFEDAERLVMLHNTRAVETPDGLGGDWLISFPDYLDYRASLGTIDELAAWQQQLPALYAEDGGAAQRLNAVDATANLLPMLGVEPVLGRGFTAQEDTTGTGERAALLSYALWQSRFGADPEVLGRSMKLDGLEFVIVGVLPRHFTGAIGGNFLPDTEVDVWLAYRNSFSTGGMEERGLTNVSVVGRRAPGASLEQARAEVAGVSAELDRRFPDLRDNVRGVVLSAQEYAVRNIRGTLWLTFGAVSLLLLIACTNVASLLLGRASARQREISLRSALGADRVRLIRQMVAECVLLAGAGGVVGTLLAEAGIRWLARAEALDIARLYAVEVDLRVALFVAAVSLATGLLFGVGPALAATRGDLQAALRRDSGAVAGAQTTSRRALVVVQVALAVVLLVGAGLLTRSLRHALDVDPGFAPDGILTARVQLPIPFVAPEAQWRESVDLLARLRERAAALPGVESAALAYQLPSDSGWQNAFTMPHANVVAQQQGLAPRNADDAEYPARFSPVSPGYFETAGIALLRGRTFTEADGVDDPRVVIVNRTFVDRLLPPGIDPIGIRLTYGNWWAGGPPEYEIVGVVEDVRFNGRTEPSKPATYFPHAQQPVREMSLLLRTAGDPLALVAPLRRELQAIDPTLPLDAVSLLSDRLAAQESTRRSFATLIAMFAATALALSAVGVYGVMSFVVSLRTREVGIRMALGAGRGQVRGRVLAQGLRLVGAGLGLGLLVAWLLGGLLEGALYGVGAADPTTFAGVAAFLAVVAAVATWVPAARATRVDPVRSLRAD